MENAIIRKWDNISDFQTMCNVASVVLYSLFSFFQDWKDILLIMIIDHSMKKPTT